MKRPTLSVPSGFSVLLGALAAGTLAAQVLTAGPKTTVLETSLFSVLQFVFSLGFAWLLTRIAAKQEFVESQKAFAIAAFRRINEIDEGVERLIAHIAVEKRGASDDLRHELELVEAISVGVRASIKSSIADWGDIIGDEISTISRIERIKEERSIAQATTPEPVPPTEDDKAAAELRAHLEKSNTQLEKLLDSLPPSLRIIAEENTRRVDPASEHQDKLEEERKNTGTITLQAFWDPTFDRDVREFAPGQKLQLVIGHTLRDRIMAVCVRDEDGRSIGVVTNNGAAHYYIFREALARYLQGTTADVSVVRIESRLSGDRRYFTIVFTDEAFAERDKSDRENLNRTKRARRLTNR